MIPGTGTASNYSSYVSNCTKNQWPYKIPVNSLADVQLYINIGAAAPGTATYELIHTCGANGGTIETIIPGSYVIGQDTNDNYYGVFKDFSGASPVCFVVAITLDSQIYFSEEYCVEPSCKTLTLLEGCYGNLDPLISYDCEGVYFGVSQGGTLGDASITYRHRVYIRDAEVSLLSIKNSFKLGRTRNFRTEKDKIFQLLTELVPEWYLYELDAVFNRGEIYIDGVRWLINDTPYEKIDDCKRTWKPVVQLKESCYQSFSCEADPCSTPAAECCDPTGITVTVQTDTEFTCCDPEIISVSVSEGT